MEIDIGEDVDYQQKINKTTKFTNNPKTITIVEPESNQLEGEDININPPSKTCKSSYTLKTFKPIEQIQKKVSLEDFEVLRQLGKGSYAKVYLARNKNSNLLVALKAVEKRFIEKVTIHNKE